MHPTRVRVKPQPVHKSRKIAGIILTAIGLLIIAMNMFFIVIRKGHVSTASKALLPVSCILILAGLCLYCTSSVKSDNSASECYASEDQFIRNLPITRVSSLPIRGAPYGTQVSHPSGPPPLYRASSVNGFDDMPPSYEDCVSLDTAGVNSRISLDNPENSGILRGHPENLGILLSHPENSGILGSQPQNSGILRGHPENSGISLGHPENSGILLSHPEKSGILVTHPENSGISLNLTASVSDNVGHDSTGNSGAACDTDIVHISARRGVVSADH